LTDLYGYAGKILRVNLGNGKIGFEETRKYSSKFIGGRGIAAKIAWDELEPNVSPFSAKNKLIFMTGPLTGTLSPGSGRISVAGIAPQVYPKPWYTRSNIGGWFGSELKYAGFDGIIVEDVAEKPVYILIHSGNVEIVHAADLWGFDTYLTQKEIMKKHGKDTVSLCIGPAGENLVHTAVILTRTKNAAGQGGFGAVMGSKKLKAIAIKRSKNIADRVGIINIADTKKLIGLWKKCVKLIQGGQCIPDVPSKFWETEIKYKPKYYACTHACPGLCGRKGKEDYGSFFWKDVTSRRYNSTDSGHVMCVSANFFKFSSEKQAPIKVEYQIPIPEALKIKNLCDKLGINQWDFLAGALLWILICHQQGLIKEKDLNLPIDPNNPDFWINLLNSIAYREGFGSLLADGTVKTAETLGIASENLPYITCGFAEHGAGRGVWGFFQYPFWIVGALLWATDSRDPFSDTGHSYARLTSGMHYILPLKINQIKKISKRVWGSEKAVTDHYAYKAQPTIWLQNRSALTSSLPTDDFIFPIVASNFTDDCSGDTSIESQLYSAVTGISCTEEELDKIGERIFNLERAIAIREGRNRKTDENVIPFFKKPNWTRKITLNENKFRSLLDEYYTLRGWDIKTGWPTESKLKELDLMDVSKEINR